MLKKRTIERLKNCFSVTALKQVFQFMEAFYTYEADVIIVITPVQNCLNVGMRASSLMLVAHC